MSLERCIVCKERVGGFSTKRVRGGLYYHEDCYEDRHGEEMEGGE